MSVPTCLVVILNFDGKEYLWDCIESVRRAMKQVDSPIRLLVVDNQSPGDDVAYIQEKFPDVSIELSAQNNYLFSLNEVVFKAKEEVVVLLNNDLKVSEFFFKQLLGHFGDLDIFAATAKVMDWEGRTVVTGKRTGMFKRAWFYKHWEHSIDRNCLTLDAGGGYAAFRRLVFIELGGFDELYHPGYCEDTDLSYRAWKRGYKIVYEPKAVVYHKMNASFNKKLGTQGVTRLIRRNEILFMLKNCQSWRFAIGCLLLLPWRAIKNVGRNPDFFWAMLTSLPRIPKALQGRWKTWRVDDRDEQEFLNKIEQS